MKSIKLLGLLLSTFTVLVLTESCNKEEGCPTGYLGENCELIDPDQIQALLTEGVTPKTLLDGGISLEQLYGKTYQNGLIFYLNTTDGTGMVAALEDQSDGAEWGCYRTDIMGLANVVSLLVGPETKVGTRIGDGKTNTDAILAECMTSGIAAKLCRDIGPEWFLPSRGELNLMYTNLYNKGYGGFASDSYWSSTEYNLFHVWNQDFVDGNQCFALCSKLDKFYVRAARAF